MLKSFLNKWLNQLPVKTTAGILVVSLVLTFSAWNMSRGNNKPSSQLLQVSFLDVGQGDSIYIRAPNGNDVLIDAGATQSVVAQLKEVLPSHDSELDLVIASHPDQDHIGGLGKIFELFEIKHYLSTDKTSSTKTFAALQEKIKNEPGIQKTTATRGQRIILDSERGVFIDILFPNGSAVGIKDTNDSSIVLELNYGPAQFLFTGDASASIEQFLIQHDAAILKTSVLKLGHHGSKTSSSDAFLRATNPEYAVVSAGKNNKYGHPNEEVLDRISALEIPLFETAVSGTITFESDGVTVWKK